MTWVNLPDDWVDAIEIASIDLPNNTPITKRLHDIVRHVRRIKAEAKDYAPQIKQARELWAKPNGDDLEIDDEPPVSPGDDPGVWVGAWVWVPMDEKEQA